MTGPAEQTRRLRLTSVDRCRLAGEPDDKDFSFSCQKFSTALPVPAFAYFPGIALPGTIIRAHGLKIQQVNRAKMT